MNSIREHYEQTGVDQFYKNYGSDYTNPHGYLVNKAIRELVPLWNLPTQNILDLAAGSGEVTQAFQSMKGTVHAIEPLCHLSFHRRIGRLPERLTFEDIAGGALAGREYAMVVCSYALHLPDKSRLPLICQQLAMVSTSLLILTPHKRPDITPAFGWMLEKEKLFNAHRRQYHRTRCRLYKAIGG